MPVGVAALLLLSGSAYASIALDQWGTAVTASRGNLGVFGDGSFVSESAGGDQRRGSIINLGNEGATSILNRNAGRLATPTLRAFAGSSDGTFSNATATAVQGYTYRGANPVTLSLDIDLTARVIGNGFVSANVGVFEADSFFGIDAFGVGNAFGPLENASLPGDSVGFLQIDDISTSRDVTSLTFDLVGGQSFYLVAVLDVGSRNGGVADATNTLLTSFQPDPALSSLFAASEAGAPGAIPEPTTLLVWTGLAGVVGWRSCRWR